MNISNYIINVEKAIETINENNYKLVALQLPEGLKYVSNKIIDFIKNNTDCNLILIGDPCYGSCDIPYNESISLDIDLIIHIGHTDLKCIKNSTIPIIYINAISKIDINEIIAKSINYLEGKKIGIATTAQHVNHIDKIIKILEKNNFKTFISQGDARIEFCGQILGCNYSSAEKIKNKIDSFLFLGSGYFHPVGLSLITKKPIIAVDPYINKIIKEELVNIKNKILKQRYGAITLSKKARAFGLLIGLKLGQNRIDLALKIKKLLDKNNKENYFIALNNFSPINLDYLNYIDCYVSTSCPRIAIDDYIKYKKPIITPIELEISLGLRKWNDYKFDEI
jgi:2-(3-amino-3-carboxypropyl)histidine synthase